MALVAVENVKEGSVLCSDVRDVNGRLMLSQGQPVNANHIRIFKIWGVPAIEIHGSGPEQAAAGFEEKESDSRDDDRLRQIEKSVRTILRNTDLSPPGMDTVFKVAVRHRCQKDLLVEFGPERILPDDFKLDLAQGLHTQIRFTDLQLPEAPGIIMEFTQVVDDPLASAEDIAEVICRSPSLATLLLKMANSPLFGRPAKVDTVSRAVSMIGVREIGTLVLSISVMRLFLEIPQELVDMRAFLRHSLACGILSRILAACKKLTHTEQMFVAGLLHDIGRLALYRYFPEQAKLLLSMARQVGWGLFDMEKECLGIDHQKLAGLLIQKWKLPISLENKIVYHHRATESPDRLAAGIVQLADLAVNALGIGHSGERIVPRLDPAVWEDLAISPGALKTAMTQTIEQIGAMEGLFAELS